jgi:hypothetical protein
LLLFSVPPFRDDWCWRAGAFAHCKLAGSRLRSWSRVRAFIAQCRRARVCKRRNSCHCNVLSSCVCSSQHDRTCSRQFVSCSHLFKKGRADSSALRTSPLRANARPTPPPAGAPLCVLRGTRNPPSPPSNSISNPSTLCRKMMNLSEPIVLIHQTILHLPQISHSGSASALIFALIVLCPSQIDR